VGTSWHEFSADVVLVKLKLTTIRYRDCAKYCLKLGLTKKALDFARKELEAERYCIGTDTEHLRKDMRGAEYWLAHLEQMYGEGNSE
jgi:hypothetical protein